MIQVYKIKRIHNKSIKISRTKIITQNWVLGELLISKTKEY